jgi:hypothetical protein
LHPHLHCLVTGGGRTAAGTWVAVRNGFLLPMRVVMAVFRGKLVAAVVSANLLHGLGRFILSNERQLPGSVATPQKAMATREGDSRPRQAGTYLRSLCLVSNPVMPIRCMRGKLERLPPFASHFPCSLPWLSQITLSKSVEKVHGYNTAQYPTFVQPFSASPECTWLPERLLSPG